MAKPRDNAGREIKNPLALAALANERDITNEVQIIAPGNSLDDAPDDIGAHADLLNEADALDNVFSELGASVADAVVKMWRVDRYKKEEAFIDEIVPQEFTLKWLKETHGGGIYRVRVYVPQRDDDGERIVGRVKLAANKQIIIDGAPRIKREDGGAVMPAQNTELIMLGFTKMAEAMNAGFVKLAEQNKPRGTMETLQELMMMQKLLGGDRPAVDPMVMMASTMKIVKEMSEFSALARGGDDDGGGGGAGGAIFMKLAERFMDGFSQLQKQQGAAPASPELETLPGPAEIPAPDNVVPITTAPVETEAEDDDLNTLMMKMALSDVLKHAERNTPPAEYAAGVFGTLPDSLFDFLEDDNWYEGLKAYDGHAAKYPVWLKAVRDELLKLDAADEPASPAAASD